MIPAAQVARITRALPFWLLAGAVPADCLRRGAGGLVADPDATLDMGWLFTGLDAALGLELENADPETPEGESFLVSPRPRLVWFPLQFVTIFALIWYATRAPHLSTLEQFGLFFGVGVISGTIGINYSHELMHQKKQARALARGPAVGDRALFRISGPSTCLFHHRYVGTTRDPVTAR